MAGLVLGPTRTTGSPLGQGAFGTVYCVVSSSSSSTTTNKNNSRQQDTNWACKVTPIPSKRTRKQDTPHEVAARRLYSEYLLYTNHVRDLCGTLLPKIPSFQRDGLEHYYNEIGGFRCLVLERMECQLMDALPKLVDAMMNKRVIQLGPTACKLLHIVQAFHEKAHLLVDIKPDNLMLCRIPKNKHLTAQSFADSIRLLDLGLAKAFGGAYGHKEKGVEQQLQGTPLYASVPVHNLQSPGRRDDVEAMLYVIGHLVLQCHALVGGQGNDAAVELPWSHATSDEAMGRLKADMVNDLESAYYESMPPVAAGKLFAALQLVRRYKYKSTPDYKAILNLFTKLDVPIKSSGGGTRYCLNDEEVEDVDMEEAGEEDSHYYSAHSTDDMDVDAAKYPPAKEKSRPGMQLFLQGGGRSERIFVAGSLVFGSKSESSDSRTFVLADADSTHLRVTISKLGLKVVPLKKANVTVNGMTVPKSGTTAFVGQVIAFSSYTMEVEAAKKEPKRASDENRKPAMSSKTLPLRRSARNATDKQSDATSNKRHCQKTKRAFVKIMTGGNEGDQFILEEGHCETFVLGSSTGGKGGKSLVLKAKDGVASKHARLDLVIVGGVVAVEVTDMKSGKQTLVNRKVLPYGKSETVFPGAASVQLGTCAIEISH